MYVDMYTCLYLAILVQIMINKHTYYVPNHQTVKCLESTFCSFNNNNRNLVLMEVQWLSQGHALTNGLTTKVFCINRKSSLKKNSVTEYTNILNN